MNMENMNKNSIQLFNECRDLMTERLARSFNDMMDRADDVLFEMTNSASSESTRLQYLNAMREIRLKRTDIENVFMENFSELFDSSIKIAQGVKSVRTNDHSASAEELNYPEESIALSNTTSKVNYKCRDALLSLDQRMGKLLDDPQLKKQENPVRPEAVCTAFREAYVNNIESGIEVRLILLKLFEQYVAMDLHDSYLQVNALIDKKVGENMEQNSQIRSVISQMKQSNSHIHDKKYILNANKIIKNTIYAYISNDSLPDFASEFLFNHWSRLMLKIYIRDGAKGEAWQHAVEVIEDMMKCIGNKIPIAERNNMGDLFTSLEQRLKFGLNVITVTKDTKNEFFAVLSKYYESLLQSTNRKTTLDDLLVDEDNTQEEAATPFGAELLFDNDLKKSKPH